MFYHILKVISYLLYNQERNVMGIPMLMRAQREYYISLVQEFNYMIGNYYHSLVGVNFDIKSCFEQFDIGCKEIVAFTNVEVTLVKIANVIDLLAATIDDNDLATHTTLLVEGNVVIDELTNADIFGQELLNTIQFDRRYAYNIKLVNEYYTYVTPDKSKTHWTGCISFVFNEPEVDVLFIVDDIIKLMSHVSDNPIVDGMFDKDMCTISYEKMGLRINVKREQELFTITLNS